MDWASEISPALWIAGFLALYMAWAIGANDVANAMGTSVGSGALTVWGAILVAGIFEFCGAFFAGGHVTDTVRKGMLDLSMIDRDQLIYGMLWLSSPLLSGVIAFFIFQITRSRVLDRPDPVAQIRKLGPVFFFFVFFIIGLVTLFKGLKPLNLDLNLGEALIGSIVLGFIGMGLGIFLIRRVNPGPEDPKNRFSRVERIFVVLQILTACAIAFAHGSNDVANSIGPLAAVAHAVQGMDLGSKAPVEPWMLAIGGVGIIVGLGTWGYRVMETVGKRITELTPSRGFAAQLSAATTIVLASQMGIPISTTHTLVGAVLGVGLARGIGALDLRVVGKIIASWVATLPIAAALSIFFFYFFKGLLAP